MHARIRLRRQVGTQQVKSCHRQRQIAQCLSRSNTHRRPFAVGVGVGVSTKNLVTNVRRCVFVCGRRLGVKSIVNRTTVAAPRRRQRRRRRIDQIGFPVCECLCVVLAVSVCVCVECPVPPLPFPH